MTHRPGTPITPATISWLLAVSQAQRGRQAPLVSTCPTFADWVALASGLQSAGKIEQLLRVPYPEPTPVTIVLGLVAPQGGPVNQSTIPKLYGAPWLTGTTPANYTSYVGTFLVEWILAGASYSVMCDLGANAITIPAADQITVSYFAHTPPALGVGISVAALPGEMPGAVATLTHVPTIIPAGSGILALQRQGFARRWKVTADVEPFTTPPIAFGPIVAQVLDSLTALDSAEAVNFPDFIGAGGISAVNQGWMEVAGPAIGYAVSNLGPVDVKAKIIEQIEVA